MDLVISGGAFMALPLLYSQTGAERLQKTRFAFEKA
jgi:hypothetical protein